MTEVSTEPDAPDAASENITASDAPVGEQLPPVAAEREVVPADPEPASTQPAPPASVDPVSAWPFVAYVVAWAAFAGVVVWQLLGVPADQAVFEARVYPLTVFGGMALTFAGPLLVVASWISSFKTPSAGKGAVFVSALLKGGVSMLVGVSLWWLALVVVDQLRLGRIL